MKVIFGYKLCDFGTVVMDVSDDNRITFIGFGEDSFVFIEFGFY
jgi:hypothetical protein